MAMATADYMLYIDVHLLRPFCEAMADHNYSCYINKFDSSSKYRSLPRVYFLVYVNGDKKGLPMVGTAESQKIIL